MLRDAQWNTGLPDLVLGATSRRPRVAGDKRNAEAIGAAFRAPHSCIAYAARSWNHPAISSGVTSCKAEPNAA